MASRNQPCAEAGTHIPPSPQEQRLLALADAYEPGNYALADGVCHVYYDVPNCCQTLRDDIRWALERRDTWSLNRAQSEAFATALPAAPSEAINRLMRFIGGETARTLYHLPPNGRFDPMRADVEAVLKALGFAAASLAEQIVPARDDQP